MLLTGLPKLFYESLVIRKILIRLKNALAYHCKRFQRFYLNFNHRRSCVVLSADVLSGDDCQGDVCWMEAILTFAGRKKSLIENVTGVPGHRRPEDVTLIGFGKQIKLKSTNIFQSQNYQQKHQHTFGKNPVDFYLIMLII